jgi:hypothetical protein
MLSLPLVECGAACFDNSTFYCDVSEMDNEQKKTDKYRILISILRHPCAVSS